MKSTLQALNKRGYSDAQLEKKFQDIKTVDLIRLIESSLPQKRTAAAKVLGCRKEKKAITPLGNALAKENALYTRIAMSEALGKIGIDALPCLIGLLGRIGKNQHKILPGKSFDKSNYPLPRDIAARTIIKIGVPALSALEAVLLSSDREQISEAIDAIGYIAFYTHERRSLKCLLTCLEKYREDELIVWKIIRAFEAYPFMEVKIYLEKIKAFSKNKILVREAERSLRQLNARA